MEMAKRNFEDFNKNNNYQYPSVITVDFIATSWEFFSWFLFSLHFRGKNNTLQQVATVPAIF